MKKGKPLRHSVEGGYKKGDFTRKAILDAALKIFAEKGFDASSTRLIASTAGVNPPALQYYFENKEGVFTSCAEMLADENIALFMPLLEEAKKAESDRKIVDCIDIVCKMVEKSLEIIFSIKNYQEVQVFISRIQSGQGPEKAFNILYNKLESPVHEAVAGLVSIICNLPRNSDKVHLRTMNLLSVIIAFFSQRRSAFAKLKWEKIDEHRLATLKKIIREDCLTLVTSWQCGKNK
ncbi:TetR/AcrR family transcriptional regulator [Pantoea stewartii]|uniref:TetR/AcrR family transcriptional regulator n=1 Tax=Pantoea stewartii TaxID=66269 RepID=UPI0016254951|nr:CerR family C-terminal domain-containing protein [Pantoea stewartii]MBC0854857.1 CerR family C-terminal domain-containing protein [Pantoea stewartii]